MKNYLSHYTAASIWNIPYIETVLGNEFAQNNLIHNTVSKYNARLRGNGKEVHSTELALPAGAVISRNGRMIASPELLFLELASELSIHRLILLGMQLCSHPPGYPAKAVTTKQKLGSFLVKAAGHRGHRKAMRAMRYVENGSASIMESLVYMILALPYALGGYGLNNVILNHEIKLSIEAQINLEQDYCITDLYYKQTKLAVEYESFTYHSSPLEQGKDMVRSAILERQGIGVMHLSTIQLYDRDGCRVFANNLAARLKKRINIRTGKFDEMHALLRALLPERKPISEA